MQPHILGLPFLVYKFAFPGHNIVREDASDNTPWCKLPSYLRDRVRRGRTTDLEPFA